MGLGFLVGRLLGLSLVVECLVGFRLLGLRLVGERELVGCLVV